MSPTTSPYYNSTTTNVLTATNDTVYNHWVSTGGIAAHNYNNGNGDIYIKSLCALGESLYPHEHVNAYDHVARRPDENAHVYTWKEHLRKVQRRRIRRQSLKLLRTVLTREEWISLRTHGYFVVQGGETEVYYRIRWQHGDSMVANIDVLKLGADRAANDNWPMKSISTQLCCHLPTDYPIGDMLAAQKLMLKYEERKFLQRANCHPVSYTANIRSFRRAA